MITKTTDSPNRLRAVVFVSLIAVGVSQCWLQADASAACCGSLAGQPIAVLSEALKSRSVFLRRDAAASLAHRGPQAVAALKPLAEALDDKDARVRRNAARALGRIGKEALPAVRELQSRFADDDPFVRLSAARAVWLITNDPETVLPVIEQELAGSDVLAAVEATRIATVIGPTAQPAADSVREAMERGPRLLAVHACEALWAIEERSDLVPILIDALDDGDTPHLPVPFDPPGSNEQLTLTDSPTRLTGRGDEQPVRKQLLATVCLASGAAAGSVGYHFATREAGTTTDSRGVVVGGRSLAIWRITLPQIDAPSPHTRCIFWNRDVPTHSHRPWPVSIILSRPRAMNVNHSQACGTERLLQCKRMV